MHGRLPDLLKAGLHKNKEERLVLLARENASGIKMIRPASKNTGIAMIKPVIPSAHAAFLSPNHFTIVTASV